MKQYEAMKGGTAAERNEIAMACGSAAKDSIKNTRKELAKVLIAMIAAGDCEAGSINAHAKEITGKDLRKDFQGVYELMGVFSAIVDGKITLTEEQFDTLEPSKLALLSPYLNVEEHKDKLEDAVDALKEGKSAKDIREIKGATEPKKPKRVIELEKELETMKAALERSGGGTAITSALIVTDIPADAPILTSRQVIDRLKADMAAHQKSEETMDVMIDKLGKALVAACTLAQVDAKEVVEDIYAELAAKTGGTVVGAPAAIEVEGIAA
jgi:hypothetical protein